MATSINCWKCLARPCATSSSRISSIVSSKPFSSTSSKLVGGPKPFKKAAPAGVKQNLRIKKKGAQKTTGRPPASGERKAMRKRIVLSNTNALAVPGMQEFNKDLVADMLEGGEEKKSLVGNVVVLPGETVDALRAIDAFKPTQGWGLFNKPGLLIRQESVELTRALVSAEDEKSTLRYVIEGSKGSGKSMMLLHAQAVAVARGWVVLHFPEAQELVNAVNDYAAIPNSNPSVWMQPTYTAEWLEKIAKANPILDTIKMTQPHNLPIEIPKGTTLGRLCELGVRDSDIAFPLFQALWSELNQSGRPPILLTLDGLSYIMRDSQYRNTNNELIHSHDLALIKHFTDFLSGSQTMKNGGAVIGATSRSHHPISLSMNLAITQALEKQQESPQTERQPFEKNYDERVEASLKDVHVMKLSGTSKDEARGLMEYWAKSGVLRQTVDERSVAEKWALAGNGVLGELQRGALRMRI